MSKLTGHDNRTDEARRLAEAALAWHGAPKKKPEIVLPRRLELEAENRRVREKFLATTAHGPRSTPMVGDRSPMLGPENDRRVFNGRNHVNAWKPNARLRGYAGKERGA